MPPSLKLTITRTRRRTVTAAPARRLACALCGREVGALTRAQALLVLGVGEAAFEEMVAAGLVHAAPAPGGPAWVCEDSLFPK